MKSSIQSPATGINPRGKSNEPEWVRQMHAHFARTGQYRPEDVRRILGDQRTQVGPRSKVDTLECAAKVKA
jgi:hypothetical protein